MTYAPNVLLLDQDHILRRATALLLADRGAHVTQTATLEEAIEMSQKRIYDVALIDLVDGMPAAGEVLRRMRQMGLVPRRIVICSDAPLGAEEADDFSEVLLKPYAFDRLVEAVFGQGFRRPTRSGVFPQLGERGARTRAAASLDRMVSPRRSGLRARGALRAPCRAVRARPRPE